MSNKPPETHLPAKHARLLRWATFATVMSWVVLTAQMLYFFLYIGAFIESNQLLLIGKQQMITARYIFELVTLFLQGALYWLVLQGIALGLKMIVETDQNYRGQPEQPADQGEAPAFYQPLKVAKLARWINWAAFVAITAATVADLVNLPVSQKLTLTYLGGISSLALTAWIITIVLVVLGIVVRVLITYLPLKALAYILRMLMQMEVNSRPSLAAEMAP